MGERFWFRMGFLSDFLKLKEKIHSQQKASSDEAIGNKKVVKANNTFIMDLVAGRLILTRPLGVGGFRLAVWAHQSIWIFCSRKAHPATLVVLDKYIAIGTQLKMERPGKGATVTVCEVLEGPIVRLKNGSVLQLKTEELARQSMPQKWKKFCSSAT